MAEATIQKMSGAYRITLPEEVRKALHVWIGDRISLQPDGERVIMKRFEPECVFCGSSDRLTQLHGKHICSRCKAAMANIKPPRPYIPFDECT